MAGLDLIQFILTDPSCAKCGVGDIVRGYRIVAINRTDKVVDLEPVAEDARAEVLMPTLQAGLGSDVELSKLETPHTIHINSNVGAINWDVAVEKDGMFHQIQVVGPDDHKITVKNAKRVMWLNGTPLDTIADGVVNVKAGSTYSVTVSANAANERYINFALDSGNQINLETKNLYSGVGTPTNDIGTDGDFYEQLDAAVNAFSIYGPKAGGKWPAAAYRKIEDIAALVTRVSALEAKKAESEFSFNRSPTTLDVYRAGMIWNDVSFGVDTPLKFLSMGDGVWQSLNRIILRAIRVYIADRQTSYPVCNSIQFYDRSNKAIPYNRWICGQRNGIYGPALGSAYAGGSTTPDTNATGWIEFEPASGFDYTLGLLRGTANLRSDKISTGIATVELHYTNGSVKSISCIGFAGGGVELFNLPAAYDFVYGGNLINLAALDLTLGQASDALDTTYGRVNGLILDSVVNRKTVNLALKTEVTTESTTRQTADAALTKRLDDLWLSYATQDWVNSQLDDINGAVNNIPAQMKAQGYAKATALNDFLKKIDADSTYLKKTDQLPAPDLTGYATLKHVDDADTALDTRVVALEARKEVKETKNKITGLPVYSVGGNQLVQPHELQDLDPFNTDARLAALEGRRINLTPYAKKVDDLQPVANRVTDLEARKEVKSSVVTATLLAGSALPITSDFPAPSASGFNNNGDGAVAGATSWTNNAPIGVSISQSGQPDDEYEISAAFGAANPSAMISFQVNGVWQDFTAAAGVAAGSLNITEFNTGNWRGATLKVKGSFTGMVGFNTTGTTYIGPVIKRKRAQGYEVEGKGLALLSDIPAAVKGDTGATGPQGPAGPKGDPGPAPDTALYALKTDIPAAPNLSPYALKTELTTEATTRADADTALGTRVTALEGKPAPDFTSYAKKVDDLKPVTDRVTALEAKPDPKAGVITDFKTDATNNQVAQMWDAYSLSSALNPRQFADVNALLAFNTTGLQLYRHAYIKLTKESVYWDKDATSGDYKPNTGPGYWLKAGSSVSEGLYFGTWDNQAGDSTATNGGHTCTRRLLRGTGIVTSNDSVFTLSGGLFNVRVGVTRHMAYGTWRNTVLLVDNAQVDSMYTGHDGGNWPGGTVMEWVVDSTAASHTVQVRRVGSNGNGNCAGWFSVEKIAPLVVTSGYKTRELCPIALTGATFNGGNSVNIPTGTGQFINFDMAANLQLATVTGSAGLTVGTPDKLNNCVWVSVADGTATGTLTVTTEAKANPNIKTLSVVKTVLQCSTTQQTYNVGVALQEGDKLLVTGDYSNDASSTWTGTYLALPNTSQRAWPWPSATDHILAVTFPSVLASSFTVTHGPGNTAFRIRRVEVIR